MVFIADSIVVDALMVEHRAALRYDLDHKLNVIRDRMLDGRGLSSRLESLDQEPRRPFAHASTIRGTTSPHWGADGSSYELETCEQRAGAVPRGESRQAHKSPAAGVS